MKVRNVQVISYMFLDLADTFRRHENTFILQLINTEDMLKKLWPIKPSFISLLKRFLNHSEALIKITLKDPALFDRCIGDDLGLIAIKPYCANIPIIQNADYATPGVYQRVRAAVKAEMLEKNKKAALIKCRYLLKLNKNGFFTGENAPQRTISVPSEILGEIAEFISKTR